MAPDAMVRVPFLRFRICLFFSNSPGSTTFGPDCFTCRRDTGKLVNLRRVGHMSTRKESADSSEAQLVQGYLAHEKPPTPLGAP